MKRRPELVVQTLAAVNVCWWGFPAGGNLCWRTSLCCRKSLLVGAGWVAFSGFIPETPVVPADAVGWSVVGGAAAGVSIGSGGGL